MFQNFLLKGLFTWSGGPRSSGVGFFCFHALEGTKQKKHTPLEACNFTCGHALNINFTAENKIEAR